MTDTIRIFRIEDWYGNGPFRKPIDQVMSEAMTGNRQADWHGLRFGTSVRAFGRMRPGHVCGTLSAHDLVRWFPRPIRLALAPLGYGVSVSEVPSEDLVVSSSDPSQAMYRPTEDMDSRWRAFATEPSFRQTPDGCAP